MKRASLWRVVLALGCFAAVAWGEPSAERAPLDLAVRFGGAFGPIQQPVGQSKGNYGGYPFEFVIFFNTSFHTTVELSLGGVADTGNFQVTRQNFGLQFDYHLLGGARRVETDFGNAVIVVRYPFNVSVTLKESFQHFTITPTDTNLDPFGGSVLVTNVGFQIRYDLGEAMALSFDALLPVYVLPMSSDKLKPSVMEFLGGLRFFL